MVSSEDVIENTLKQYTGFIKRKYLILLSMAMLLLALTIFTIHLGSTDLSYREIIRYLFNPDDSWNSDVVWDLRFKPIVAALLAGSALALAGCIMQSILRNPLASPFTLGISNAAAFGASIGIITVGGSAALSPALSNIGISGPIAITVCAFAFAMIATLVMIGLVKLTGCSPETIVLAGLAISAIFSAGLAFIQYIADDIALPEIVFWQFGSLSKVGWTDLALIAVVVIAATTYFMFKRMDLNIMESGEEVATGLGVNVKTTRYLGLTITAILTAVVVSFMGVIGFIGLIGPHMIKRLIGNDTRYAIPGSMLMGALVLLIAYIVGMYAFPSEIPVGIITSAIGGPAFILILLKGRGKAC